MATAEEVADMALDAEDLNKTDEGIFEMLREGRCTPRYIAGELNLQQPYVNQRLKRLVEHGHVERIDRGLYELVDDPRQQHDTNDIDAGVAGESTKKDQREDEAMADGTDRQLEARGGEGDPVVDDVRDQLRDMDLPGSGKRYEKRVEAVATIWEELRSNPGERLFKSDFDDLLAGEDVGYGSFGSLWSNWVKSNPAQGHKGNVLESLPGVTMDGDAYVYDDE